MPPLAEKDALAAFEVLKNTPEFFRRDLTHAKLGPQAALEDTRAHVISDANFRDLWNKLLPADQAVLKLFMAGVTDLYSETNRLRLGLSLGLEKPVTKNTPKNSLRRLQDEGLVARFDHGEYQVQDEVLAEWLRNRELDT